MKRCWVLLLAMLASTAPAFAQFTTVTATVKDPNGIPYAGAILNAVLVPSTGGGYTLSGQPYSGRIGPVTLDVTGSFTVNFGDVTMITPGSPQWQITIDSAAATINPPLGTGPQSFTFTSTGTTISGSSPVSLSTSLNALALKLTNFANSGIAPNTPGIPQNNGPSMIFASNYGVKADAKDNCLANITNGSNQVTISGTSGTQFSLADQGAMFEGTNYDCAAGGGGGTLIISGFICASGGFVNSTTVNICTTATGNTPANATATCLTNSSTSCPVQWGQHDDTAAWNSSFATVSSFPVCGTLVMPAGRSILSAPIINTSPATSLCSLIGQPGPNAITQAFRVTGQGPQVTVMVPWNTFNAASCAGNGLNACLFAIPLAGSPVSIGYDHFGIDGGGIGTVTNANNKNIFYMPGPGNYQDITVGNWGFLNSNFTAFNYGGNSGDLVTGFNLYSYFGGSRCFQSGGVTALFGMDCFDTQGAIINAGSSQNSCTELHGSNLITGASTANGGALTVIGGSSNGCLQTFGGYFTDSGSGGAIQCGGVCYINGTTLAGNGSSTATPLYLQDTAAHPGIVHITKALITNTAQKAVGGGVAGSILYDECGNTIVGNFTGTNISYTACPNGPSIGNVPTLSGTGPCATITTQLPSTTGGWSGSFECTGTTGAATVTITFGYTAPNGWNLTNAWDQTTVANTLHQNAGGSTTTLIIGAATVTQNDVISWGAMPF